MTVVKNFYSLSIGMLSVTPPNFVTQSGHIHLNVMGNIHSCSVSMVSPSWPGTTPSGNASRSVS